MGQFRSPVGLCKNQPGHGGEVWFSKGFCDGLQQPKGGKWLRGLAAETVSWESTSWELRCLLCLGWRKRKWKWVTIYRAPAPSVLEGLSLQCAIELSHKFYMVLVVTLHLWGKEVRFTGVDRFVPFQVLVISISVSDFQCGLRKPSWWSTPVTPTLGR